MKALKDSDRMKNFLKGTFISLTAIAILASSVVWADESSPDPFSDMGVTTLKMLGSLVLVIGLILVVTYGIRRLRFGASPFQGGPKMRVLGTLTLAPKRSIALIEVCGELLLLGVGTENVTLISKIEDIEDQEAGGQIDQRRGGNFLSILKGKRVDPKGGEESG